MEPVIDDREAVAAFARDGVVCVRQVLSAQEAAAGAPGFPYRSRRRVLSLRYLAADARHAPRPWRTSPPFDGLEAELPAGAAMDHPLFPVVWPR